MFTKFFASFVILFVGFNLFVFISPEEADEFADLIGILPYNHTVRSLKSRLDSTSDTLLQIQSSSGVIYTAKETVQQTQEKINEVRNLLNDKIQQTNQVVDAVKETKDSIDKLTDNLSTLASFSGTSHTGTKNENTTTGVTR